jgi:glycosyltransferase involved in cell wall biosynthesis
MSGRPRLLLVSYHALPSVTPGSLRVSWMASQLAGRGWDVTVLTATPNPAGVEGARVVSTAARGARPEPVTASSPGYARALWNNHAIPDRFVLWSGALREEVNRLLEGGGADVVLSTSPPHSSQLALARLRSRRKFRWVADFRDPWTAPLRRPRGVLSRMLQRRMERRVLSACDAVIANTEGNRTALRAAFPQIPRAKFHVVPNAYDDAVFNAGDEAPVERADVTYVGELYLGMVDRLVPALRHLQERSGADVPRIAVYGEVDPREWDKFRAAGLDAHVELRGHVPHDESLRVMRRARSLLLLLPDEENWASCVPSKLYPYLASGRPILALVPEGDAAGILRATAAGCALTDDDPEATAAAVGSFVGRVRSGGPWPERNEPVVSGFAASALAERLDGVLRGVLEPAP